MPTAAVVISRASDPKTARETARRLKIMFRFADDSMMVLIFDWISRRAFLCQPLVSMGKMKEVTMDTALLVKCPPTVETHALNSTCKQPSNLSPRQTAADLTSVCRQCRSCYPYHILVGIHILRSTNSGDKVKNPKYPPPPGAHTAALDSDPHVCTVRFRWYARRDPAKLGGPHHLELFFLPRCPALDNNLY